MPSPTSHTLLSVAGPIETLTRQGRGRGGNPRHRRHGARYGGALSARELYLRETGLTRAPTTQFARFADDVRAVGGGGSPSRLHALMDRVHELMHIRRRCRRADRSHGGRRVGARTGRLPGLRARVHCGGAASDDPGSLCQRVSLARMTASWRSEHRTCLGGGLCAPALAGSAFDPANNICPTMARMFASAVGTRSAGGCAGARQPIRRLEKRARSGSPSPRHEPRTSRNPEPGAAAPRLQPRALEAETRDS